MNHDIDNVEAIETAIMIMVTVTVMGETTVIPMIMYQVSTLSRGPGSQNHLAGSRSLERSLRSLVGSWAPFWKVLSAFLRGVAVFLGRLRVSQALLGNLEASLTDFEPF